MNNELEWKDGDDETTIVASGLSDIVYEIAPHRVRKERGNLYIKWGRNEKSGIIFYDCDYNLDCGFFISGCKNAAQNHHDLMCKIVADTRKEEGNWKEQVRVARKTWAGRDYDHLNLMELFEAFRKEIDPSLGMENSLQNVYYEDVKAYQEGVEAGSINKRGFINSGYEQGTQDDIMFWAGYRDAIKQKNKRYEK